MSDPDDGDSEVIVMRRSDFFELLGEFALPPYPCSCGGGDVSVAPIVEAIKAKVEERQL